MSKIVPYEVLGLSSRAGGGKNHIAEKILLPLLPPKNTMVVALADHFKIDAVAKDRCPYERVFIQKDEDTRRALQYRGTEDGRLKYGEDIWIRTLEAWMRAHYERGVQRFIITDVRFPNELEWVHSLGGKVFRIVAPNRTEVRVRGEATSEKAYRAIMDHPSESAMDVVPLDMFDRVLYNDYGQEMTILNAVRDLVVEMQPRYKTVVFCDLDDTICRCHEYYSEVIDIVMNRFSITNEARSRAIANHIDNFATRYFAKDDFARALVAAVRGAIGSLSVADEGWIISQGLSVYNRPYDLIDPNIPMVLDRISRWAKLVIFTLGDRVEQTRKIIRLGLPYQVEIFHHKDANMFRHLKATYPAENYVMVGDSLARDIKPAVEAGVNMVLHIGGENFRVLDESVAQWIEGHYGDD